MKCFAGNYANDGELLDRYKIIGLKASTFKLIT